MHGYPLSSMESIITKFHQLCRRCKAHLTCQSLQVSALHENMTASISERKEICQFTYLVYFTDRKFEKVSSPQSLVVYTDPAPDMLPGPCHLSILSNLPKKGSWKGACTITVEYGILK